MAPEMVRKKKYNHKIDIWALGILFHMMFAGGKHPIEGKGTNEIEEMIGKGIINICPIFQNSKYEPIIRLLFIFKNLVIVILFSLSFY